MIFEPPLQEARLLRRYKRFLADAELEDGRVATLHCPNTGSMLRCDKPGSRIWYWDSANPSRKYPLTWELLALDDGSLVGINTLRANRLVKEALSLHRIGALSEYDEVRSEVSVGGARIDFRLSAAGLPDCFLEVKSVTLGMGNGLGIFPDAPSVRARRHLETLSDLVGQGFRAVLLYCAQHTGIRRVAPAHQIDPQYAEALTQAVESGVEVLACGVHLDLERIEIASELPVGSEP